MWPTLTCLLGIHSQSHNPKILGLRLVCCCCCSVSLIFVLCSPVDMDDEISSQGLTQVRSNICFLKIYWCLFSLWINMVCHDGPVCTKLCKQRHSSAARNIYTRDTPGAKNTNCSQGAWIHTQGKVFSSSCFFFLLSFMILGSKTGFQVQISLVEKFHALMESSNV